MKTHPSIPHRRNAAFAILSAVALSLCAPVQAAAPIQFEYTVANAKLKNRNLESLLNTYAKQGWELVQITNQGTAIFKRAKR